jgi:hypothetical protein
MRTLLVVVMVACSMVVSLVAGADADSPGGTFTDDNGNTHEGAIEAIAVAAITLGCNPPANTLYCPSESVTRGQMAAFLVRAFDLEANTHPGFDDVPDDHTFAVDIGKLATAGITRGCNPPDNDRYCPDEAVTRAEMSAFLVRAVGLTTNSHPGFADVSSTDTFAEDIGRLATAGITRGCNPPDNDLYCPDEAVGRDQMASFLARARGLTLTSPPPVTTFASGVQVVGNDIPPGVFRNVGFSNGCYWERLSGFSGEFEDIIANDFTDVGQIVEIKSSDAGFDATASCGTWTNQLVSSRQVTPAAPFGPGTYRVPAEVTPGTWRSTPDPGESCYWERRSGFSGDFDDIIANDFTDATSIVEIAASDVGFLAEEGCGPWTRIG